jgi:hypothetical protein
VAIPVELHFQPFELNPQMAPEVFEQALRQVMQEAGVVSPG